MLPNLTFMTDKESLLSAVTESRVWVRGKLQSRICDHVANRNEAILCQY